MDVLRRIFRRPSGQIEVPGVIDHLPVNTSAPDWREERLKQAQERYGRPFKCAGADMPHEILVKPRQPAPAANDVSLAERAANDPAPPHRTPAPLPAAFRFGRR